MFLFFGWKPANVEPPEDFHVIKSHVINPVGQQQTK